MQIERAEVFLVPLRLREPFESSAATVQDRIIMLVALHGDGKTGWGECVAGETPHYSPETTETAWELWARIRPESLVEDPDIAAIDALISRLRSADLEGGLDTLRQTAEEALEVASVTRRLLDRGRAALARTQGGLYG